MKFHILNRKVHYWASSFVAIPLLVIIGSGILLHLKKRVAWIQPTELTGSGQIPALSFDRILEACRQVPQAKVRTWSDINRIDVRPARGILKVWTRSNWEIQLDHHTGQVLQVAYRRSDLIESIHDGSWFHEKVKWWIFLPSGVTLLLLWFTGVYLFALPYILRSKR